MVTQMAINPHLPRNQSLLINAKRLRKDMTKEERKLWFCFLRTHNVKFQRQKLIGNYIVDFYCDSAKLVVELDGSQHYETQGEQYDKIRTDYLKSLGLTVVRFTNLEIIKNFRGVCETIDNIVSNNNY
jgi:very-short-patch-repair endonuclease